jgi:uncharacterized membrane protein YcaP (DUF421 family)
MPAWLIGQADHLGEVAAKAVLMYLVALVGLRLAHRRTLAQWTTIDVAAAVAVGAIIGRTALATGQSFAVGAVALVSLLAAHTVLTLARFVPGVTKATDHRVRVLIDHGTLRHDQLRLVGVTEDDLLAQLRTHGVERLDSLRYALYETKGGLTLVREDGSAGPDSDLVKRGLRDAAGYRKK